MTDSVASAVDADQLKKLDDAHWRRLGITQTFDRLLVEAVAAAPGTAPQIQDNVARSLSGGAVKFWELSFPNLLKDLSRRGHVRHVEGRVELGEKMREQLDRIIGDLTTSASHVDPTPGITLEAVLDLSRQREERAKAKAAAARSAARPKAARATDEGGSPTPRKRGPAAGDDDAPAPKPRAAGPKVREAARVAAAAAEEAGIAGATAEAVQRPEEARKLFTSIRLNKLLDSMATNRLLKDQVGRRLELGGQNLERFLHVTGAVDVTRTTPDGMVELHWRGRELSRTQAGERRQALTDLVRDLRAYAEAEE